MNMRQSHTAVVERNQLWEGDFATEPYEVGWSHEAIFFVQILHYEESPRIRAKVQISPDGIHWCNIDNDGVKSVGSGFLSGYEYSKISEGAIDFLRVSHYGGWLRLAGTVKNGRVWALVHLALKA